MTKSGKVSQKPLSTEGVLGILKSNRKKNFVDRILNADVYPDMPTPNGNPGQRSSHLMAYATDDEGAFAFPEIVYDPKTKTLFKPKDPIKHALDTGEYIRFGSEGDAKFFTENYKIGMPTEKAVEDMSSDEAMDYYTAKTPLKK
jgi:hypothetical protein